MDHCGKRRYVIGHRSEQSIRISAIPKEVDVCLFKIDVHRGSTILSLLCRKNLGDHKRFEIKFKKMKNENKVVSSQNINLNVYSHDLMRIKRKSRQLLKIGIKNSKISGSIHANLRSQKNEIETFTLNSRGTVFIQIRPAFGQHCLLYFSNSFNINFDIGIYIQ